MVPFRLCWTHDETEGQMVLPEMLARPKEEIVRIIRYLDPDDTFFIT